MTVATATPAVSIDLSWDQVLAWRMHRHHLCCRAGPDEVVAVVERLCGVHAQVLSCAKLSLWARIEGLDPAALDEALWARRDLVKVWAMRGTLHLLPARELGVWTAGLAAFRSCGGVGPEEFELLAATVGRALEGRLRTREQLAADVQWMTGSAALAAGMRDRWGMHLKPASLRGLLCFAPSAGRHVRFTAPQTWIHHGVEDRDPEAGGAAIVRRYLGGYGPATVDDIARWWGSGLTSARRAVAALGNEIVEVTVAGEQRWALASDVDAIAAVAPTRLARLLPGFDQWTVAGPRGGHALLRGSEAHRVYRPQGWISPVVLVDGRIAGIWRHERRGRRLVVSVQPFGRLGGWVQAGLEEDALRLAAFLDGDLDLRWER